MLQEKNSSVPIREGEGLIQKMKADFVYFNCFGLAETVINSQIKALGIDFFLGRSFSIR